MSTTFLMHGQMNISAVPPLSGSCHAAVIKMLECPPLATVQFEQLLQQSWRAEGLAARGRAHEGHGHGGSYGDFQVENTALGSGRGGRGGSKGYPGGGVLPPSEPPRHLNRWSGGRVDFHIVNLANRYVVCMHASVSPSARCSQHATGCNLSYSRLFNIP
jgi:hypothetical protein